MTHTFEFDDTKKGYPKDFMHLSGRCGGWHRRLNFMRADGTLDITAPYVFRISCELAEGIPLIFAIRRISFYQKSAGCFKHNAFLTHKWPLHAPPVEQ